MEREIFSENEIFRSSIISILSIIILSQCFHFPINIFSLLIIFDNDNPFHYEAERSIFFIFMFIFLGICSAFLVRWVKKRARKLDHNNLLVASNSLAIGAIFGMWMIYAAWQHNPNNSIHWEFYEINYSYLLLIFGSWLLVVGVLTAAAQAAGLALAYLLRRGTRKLAARGG